MNDKLNGPNNSSSSSGSDQSDQFSSTPAIGDSSHDESKKGEEKNFETFESSDFEQGINSTGTKTSIKDFIQNKFSEVSAGTGSKGIIILVLVAVLIGGIYMLLSSPEAVKEREKAEKEAKLQEKKEELLKSAKVPSSVAETPGAQQQIAPPPKKDIAPPAPPQLTAPQPPAPPPPPVPSTPQAPVFPASPSAPAPGAVAAAPPGAPPQIGAAPGANQASISDVLSGEAEKKRQELLARRKASIMVTGGGGGGGGGAGGASTAGKDASGKPTTPDAQNASSKSKNSSFLGFDNGVTATAESRTSAASSVKATNVGALDRMIAQGKIINAVLESAINTDIPGSLRAIVARDVFAENGNNILIPKGSRLVGTYNAQTKTGQTRIGIMWNRLIRPDGVDIAIASDATDELGRAGVGGYTDDKFWLKIGTAVLTSYVVPVIAQKLLNVKDNAAITSTTASNGVGVGGTGPSAATTTTGTVASQQLQNTVQQLQQSINDAVTDATNTNTTVTIDQGTMVNVYVNKDLLFTPDQIFGATKVIK